MEQLNPYRAQFATPMSTYDGYGIDPSLMTPAYMANFRPAYKNVGENEDHTVRNVVASPFDGVMWGAQNIGVPLATWWAAHKMFSKSGERLGAAVGRKTAQVGGSMIGGTFSRVGLGVIPKAASGMGLGTMAAKGAGALGGFVGSALLPIAAATIASNIVNEGFIENYSAMRQGSNALQDNLSNVYTGTGMGGRIGVSAERAAELAGEINKIGVEDVRFNGMQVQEIADLATREGILQEHTMLDKDGIVSAVKNTVEIIKVIQDITENKDFRDAVQYLGKLKRMGISTNDQMTRVMADITSMAKVAGVSVDQMINSVGEQGHMIFQQAGISPTVGMKTSMSAYSGFANAYRSGMISTAQMAALGGVSGATQLVTEGALSAATDHWSVLMGMTGADSIDSAIGEFSRYGDPIEAYGDMYMNRSIYSQRFMEGETAGTTILKRLSSQVKQVYGDDRVTLNRLASLAPSNNISPQELRAAILENQSLKDARSRLMVEGAKGATARERFMNMMEANGLDWQGNSVIGAAERGLKHVEMGIKDFGDDTANLINKGRAWAEDTYNEIDLTTRGFALPEDNYAVFDGDMAKVRIGEYGRTRTGMRTSFSRSSDYDKEMARLIEATSSSDDVSRELSRKILSGKKIDVDALRELNKHTRGFILGTDSDIDAYTISKEMSKLSLERTDVTDKQFESVYRKEFDKLDDGAFNDLMSDLSSGKSVEDTMLPRMLDLMKNGGEKKYVDRAEALLDKVGFSKEEMDEWRTGAPSMELQKRFRDYMDNFTTNALKDVDVDDPGVLRGMLTEATRGMDKDLSERVISQAMSDQEALVGHLKTSTNKVDALNNWVTAYASAVQSQPEGMDIEGMESFKEAATNVNDFNKVLSSDDGTVSMFGKLNTKLKDVNNELDRLKLNVDTMRRQGSIK